MEKIAVEYYYSGLNEKTIRFEFKTLEQWNFYFGILNKLKFELTEMCFNDYPEFYMP